MTPRKLFGELSFVYKPPESLRNYYGISGTREIKKKGLPNGMEPTKKLRKVSCHAEWDTPTYILTHRPGFEAIFGSYFPAGGLCQGPYSLKMAQQEHDHLVEILKKELPNTPVERVTDIIVREASNPKVMGRLRDIASQSLAIRTASRMKECLDLCDLSGKYALEFLSPEELINTCLIRPEIIGRTIKTNTGYESEIRVRPINNFIFSRDQQIITDRGLVMGYMNSSQRLPETLLMKLVFETLNINPILEIESIGRMEGGDFIPAGEVAFQGRGLRTDHAGVEQMLSKKAYGFEEVGVVIDYQKKQDEMHLDTYFNIISEDKCVVLKDRIEKGNPKESQVIIYEKDGDHYHSSTKTIPLREYLIFRGITPITITKEEQLAYAPNFLTIAPNKVIGIDISAKEEIKQRLKSLEAVHGQQDFFRIRDEQGKEIDYKRMGEEFVNKMTKAGVTFIPVNFNHMNMMYGGIHCGTQVIR